MTMRSMVGRAAAALMGLAWGMTQAQAPADPYSYARTSSFTYQVNGLLQSETIEPDNAASCITTAYGYDAFGNKNSATTSNCAGATGRAVFTSRTSTSTYAAVAGQPITVAGASVSVAVPAGLFATSAANALNQTETRSYDPRFGAVLTLTGPNALTTSVQVDDFGRKIRETRADGTSTVIYHCILTGKGLGDTSSNSAGCTLKAQLSPVSGEIPSDAIGYVQSEPRDTADGKMGPAVRVYTDRLGRKLREVSEAFDGSNQPRGFIARDTQYNSLGAVVLTTEPYFLGADSSTVAGFSDMGMTLTGYDALGRPIQIDVADVQGNLPNVNFNGRGTRNSARTVIAYNGLSTITTNPKGQTRTEEKNVDGKVVRISDAYSAQIAHQHDAFGNLVKTKDALQNLVTLSYDIRGRKLGITDPDSGYWQYDYNALGELVWQQSPNQRAAGSATTMVYDVLGRMSSRVEPEYTSTWSYDKYADGSACSKGIGKLCESNTSHGINKKIVYDTLGRPASSRTTVANGPSFAAALSYEATTGRIATQTYPTGVKVSYSYTRWGFVSQLTTATAATISPLPATRGGSPGSLPAGSVLWAASTVNAWGKAETQTLGNGVTSRAAFDPNIGRISSVSGGAGSATNVLNQTYTWDNLNNLLARTDANGDGNTGAVSETFTYDSINRLTQYAVAAPLVPNLARTVTLAYNAIGNVLYKSDLGNYDYAPYGNTGGVTNPRPHALASVAGTNIGTVGYTYDANGNVTNTSGGKYRSIGYTSFNLPDSNTGAAGPGGSPRYTWQYDENHQRIKEVHVDSAGARTTWYQHPDNLGGLSFESETVPSGVVSNRHYLSAGGQTVVLVSTGALPTLGAGVTTPPSIASITLVKVEYWHKDHLGSLAATTDHAGSVTARYAYDPFGKRRMTNGRYDEFGTLVVDWAGDVNYGTDRGFTGHEHLDDIGVVHMNGRLYDAQVGRFMQSDPLIQAMGDLQSYNRYAYCFNAPANCTDPSGYFSLRRFVAGVFIPGLQLLGLREVARSQVGYQIGSLAINVGCYASGGGPVCVGAGQAGWAALAGHSASSSIEIGLRAGISSSVNGLIGGIDNPIVNATAHAAWGCVEGRASGGGDALPEPAVRWFTAP